MVVWCVQVDEKRRAEAAARIESSDLILDPQERAQYAHLLAHKRYARGRRPLERLFVR